MPKPFRRRGTPLQTWRSQYRLLCDEITKAKTPDETWGRFKKARGQSRLMFLRELARNHMAKRQAALLLTREAWAIENEGKGHNSRAAASN